MTLASTLVVPDFCSALQLGARARWASPPCNSGSRRYPAAATGYSAYPRTGRAGVSPPWPSACWCRGLRRRAAPSLGPALFFSDFNRDNLVPYGIRLALERLVAGSSTVDAPQPLASSSPRRTLAGALPEASSVGRFFAEWTSTGDAKGPARARQAYRACPRAREVGVEHGDLKRELRGVPPLGRLQRDVDADRLAAAAGAARWVRKTRRTPCRRGCRGPSRC